MAFRHDPMDIDDLAHHGEIDYMDEDDAMDFIPEPIIKTLDLESHSIASSFFQHTYSKSGDICSNVSSMFGKVSLSDAKNEEFANKDATHKQQLSPPPSPPIRPLSVARIEHSLVETPVTPISLPNSPGSSPPPSQGDELCSFKTTENNTPQYNTHYSPTHHYNRNHHPTFVYHAAQPIDTSHGRVVYIFGIFKITCYSVILFCCLYIGYQLLNNVHHDMQSKISSYESDMLGNQMYCQEQYHVNRCGPSTRLPAVQELCRSWEQCMMRPVSIGKTKVLAEIIGEAANGFSEVLSLRTMIYSLCISYGLIWSMTHAFKAYSSTERRQQKQVNSNTTRYTSPSEKLVIEPSKTIL